MTKILTSADGKVRNVYKGPVCHWHVDLVQGLAHILLSFETREVKFLKFSFLASIFVKMRSQLGAG